MLKMPGIDEFREQCLDWLRQHWAGDLTQAEQAFNQAACGAVAAPHASPRVLLLAPALDATGIRFPTAAANWSIDFIETMTFKALSQWEEAT